jgi:hypothetical protein
MTKAYKLTPLAPLTGETECGSWPTVSANKLTRSGELVNADGTEWDGVSKPHSKTTGKPVTTALADAVAKWPTPRSSVIAASATMLNVSNIKNPRGNLEERVYERETDKPSILTGSLNPTWVEWLMGYPIGFTDLKG